MDVRLRSLDSLVQLDAKSHLKKIKRFFVGYTKSGYVLWHPYKKNYIVSIQVKFNEQLVSKNLYCKSEIARSEAITDINDYDWLKNLKNLNQVLITPRSEL